MKKYKTITSFSFSSYNNPKILGNAALIVFGNPTNKDLSEIAKHAKTIGRNKVESDICITSKVVYKSDYEYNIWHYFYNGVEDKACGHATLASTRAIIAENKLLSESFYSKSINDKDTIMDSLNHSKTSKTFRFNLNLEFKENIDNPFMDIVTDGKKFSLCLNETWVEEIDKNHYFHKLVKELYGDNYFKLFKTGYNDYVVICTDIKQFRTQRPSKEQIFSFSENIKDYRLVVSLCESQTSPYNFEGRVFCHDCPPPFYEDIANGSSNTSLSTILYKCGKLTKYKETNNNSNDDVYKYNLLWPYNYEQDGFYGGEQVIEYNYTKKKVVVNTEIELGDERTCIINEDGKITFEKN